MQPNTRFDNQTTRSMDRAFGQDVDDKRAAFREEHRREIMAEAAAIHSEYRDKLSKALEDALAAARQISAVAHDLPHQPYCDYSGAILSKMKGDFESWVNCEAERRVWDRVNQAEAA